MTPYKGIIRIECDQDACKTYPDGNVKAECINCENASSVIIDLDAKELIRFSRVEEIATTSAELDEEPNLDEGSIAVMFQK